MNGLKIILLFIICGGLFNFAAGQENIENNLSNTSISVLTCAPGNQLFNLFGHTAIRVRDIEKDVDLVYNYGTFDFDAPNFALNFLRGKLTYALTLTNISSFLYEYNRDRRSVDEQVLSLSPVQKSELIRALQINLEPENRYYKYDFYFDNCTTRIRDLLENKIGSISYPTSKEDRKTFRNQLHENLTTYPWTKFGMDIILGTLSDQVTSERDQMFLPEYYRDYLDQATSEGDKIIKSTNNIFTFAPLESHITWCTPWVLFIILMIIEAIGFFLIYISGERGFLFWFDYLWFLALSIASVTFLFMWLATDHLVCKNNWNLLWAGPWVILSFINISSVRQLCFYLTLTSSIILLIGWNLIPQQLHPAIIPIALISALKSARLLGIAKWMDKYRKTLVATSVLLLGTLVIQAQDKIGGITIVAPPQSFESNPMNELKKVNANWVAFVPYGYSRPGDPQVRFGSDRQWWGERKEGIEQSLKLAKANKLKVLLKPQVWIPGGWVGEMDFEEEQDWKIWETSYREYVMTFVTLAIEYDVEMFCIGTEYRISVNKREAFWRNLISEIRKIYDGKITYSSNWDSYHKVPIWDIVDYIGISAYFPLSNLDTPPTLLLSYQWNKYVKKLKKLSKKFNRQILFTEYGYLSVNGAAGETWNLEKNIRSLDINEQAQANGYEALFKAFWTKDFWAGGFLWKWFPEGKGHEGYPERDYTPQNKIAQSILSHWYSQ